MTTPVDIGLLVEEYGRTSYEVGYSDSQHYDPGAKYKDQERRESLQKLTAAIEELCTALTASAERVAELERFAQSVQVPTKDGTWKEVMFRLADEARILLAKGAK
jgi:hypothetical protein